MAYSSEVVLIACLMIAESRLAAGSDGIFSLNIDKTYVQILHDPELDRDCSVELILSAYVTDMFASWVASAWCKIIS